MSQLQIFDNDNISLCLLVCDSDAAEGALFTSTLADQTRSRKERHPDVIPHDCGDGGAGWSFGRNRGTCTPPSEPTAAVTMKRNGSESLFVQTPRNS